MYEVCISCPKLGNPCKGPNFYALTISQQIEWIKKRKTFLGWTNAKLAEVSKIPKGTIDSLLSGNRTGANIETLRPIFDALIGNFSDGLPCPNPPSAEGDAAELQLAQHTETIAAKEQIIKEQQAEIDKLRKYIKHSDDLHVQDKENAVREYKKAFIFQRVLATVLAVLLAISLGVIFVALCIDKSNPNIGFFWLDEAAAFFSGHTSGIFDGLSGLKL